jgi:hypothetical protein
MVGVFDGERYRWYKTVEDFLACELNRDNRGKWFYAHAGGLADIQFLFERLVHKDYAVKASFSGSSAIIVHVGKGLSTRNEARGDSLGHDVYHFVDSYWLLRDTLRNIGKSIGLEKGGVELSNDGQDEAKIKAWFRDVSLRELVAYNEQDCVILWKAIDAFQMKLWEFGGQLQMTIASSAMQLFRRKFLSEQIATDERINEISRLSYVASRVEVFEREANDAFYYDVNSSFPFSMTQPLPGQFERSYYGRLPKGHYLADVDIEVPDTYIPPLPMRAGGRVFFPTGRWRSWFNNVDVDFLLRSGGKINKVYGAYGFAPFHDLTEYVHTLYAKRKASKDEFEKYCYKLLLNALYGKFAESDTKTGLVINPSAAMMQTFDPELVQNLFGHVFLVPEKVNVPHMHVPISSHITANSRGPVLTECLYNANHPHYADTDGFSNLDVFPSGPDLGALKLEKYWSHAHYEAPKLYQGHGVEWKEGKWQPITVTKAKGFSLGRDKQKAEEMFLQLVNGGEIHVTRMERVRSLLRSAETRGLHPRETEIAKRLSKNVIGKRFMYPDGTTRPWTVEELKETYPEETK